ncbi:MAG: hypothetical protein HY796_08055 [Elusimicrobia bacterium]|nr:hypothetical protein [Elusimicrobiota bacterium]
MKIVKCVLIFMVMLFTGFIAGAAGDKNSFVLFLSDFGTKDDSAAQCKGDWAIGRLGKTKSLIAGLPPVN